MIFGLACVRTALCAHQCGHAHWVIHESHLSYTLNYRIFRFHHVLHKRLILIVILNWLIKEKKSYIPLMINEWASFLLVLYRHLQDYPKNHVPLKNAYVMCQINLGSIWCYYYYGHF